MTHLVSTTLAVTTAAIVLAGLPAEAAAPTRVAVSLGGNDSPHGSVKSAKRACMAGVTVTVYRQVGTRGGGNDVRVGSDGTSLQGTRWAWSIGNPGLDDGQRIYAVVWAHGSCPTGISPTVTVRKN